MMDTGPRPPYIVCSLILASFWVIGTGPLAAQERETHLLPSAAREALRTPPAPRSVRPLSQEPSWIQERAFIASAIVPGSGQWILGQGRWALYLVAEGAAWFEFSRRRSDGYELRREYRDLAWSVARESITEGPRVDGSFEYYEAMTRYPASGAFDLAPEAPGVQPESDAATYNGMIWALARDIFLPGDPDEDDEGSPEYALAMEFYLNRSYPPELGWNWRGEEEKQARFGQLIRESDDALRRATAMLGIVIGNHVLSSIDALVSTHLGYGATGGARLQIRLVPLRPGIQRHLPGHGRIGSLSDGRRAPWALQATLFH